MPALNLRTAEGPAEVPSIRTSTGFPNRESSAIFPFNRALLPRTTFRLRDEGLRFRADAWRVDGAPGAGSGTPSWTTGRDVQARGMTADFVTAGWNAELADLFLRVSRRFAGSRCDAGCGTTSGRPAEPGLPQGQPPAGRIRRSQRPLRAAAPAVAKQMGP